MASISWAHRLRVLGGQVVVHRDPPAVPGEIQRDDAADPPGAAGDENGSDQGVSPARVGVGKPALLALRIRRPGGDEPEFLDEIPVERPFKAHRQQRQVFERAPPPGVELRLAVGGEVDVVRPCR